MRQNCEHQNTLEIAGISVTAHTDQTWLKKEKKYYSFDDTEIRGAIFSTKK